MICFIKILRVLVCGYSHCLMSYEILKFTDLKSKLSFSNTAFLKINK